MKVKSAVLPRFKVFYQLLKEGQFLKAGHLLVAYGHMVARPTRVFSYPITIVIDPGNVCNLRCALCITGQRKSRRPVRLLSLSDFKKIINQLGKWAVQLDLYNWGEPLLNKDIFMMIDYAKKAGLKVVMSSNLLLLTPEAAERIVKSGLDTLIVSLHGATPKTTEIYMQGGDFRKAIENLKMLIVERRKLKSKTPQINWRYVVSRYNEQELEMAEKLANDLEVDIFEPLPIRLDVGLDIQEIKKSIREHSQWLPKNEKYRLYDVGTLSLKNHPRDCFWPWEIVSINADGTIQPCCVFSNPAYDFGNLLKTPFGKIWNGRKYQLARKVIRDKIKTDRTTVCGLCVCNNFLAK